MGFGGVSHLAGSKPCTPAEHENRWQMDVHPPQNGAIGDALWPCLHKKGFKPPSHQSQPPNKGKVSRPLDAQEDKDNAS